MASLNNLQLRKNRVRAKIGGTAEPPRLSVSTSIAPISAQLNDDVDGKTHVAATTVGKKMTGSMTDKAAKIGEEIAKNAKKAKIAKVVFDRNGRAYAKRLHALADAARKGGLEF